MKRECVVYLFAVGGLFPVLAAGSSVSIANPSFHDSLGTPPVGQGPISGWTSTPTVGVNPVDNGVNPPSSPFNSGALVPDGNDFALIQGVGTLSQNVTGLDTSKQYWLQFHAAGRNCCGAGRGTLSVSYGGQSLVPATVMNPVPGGSPYEFFQVAFSPLTAVGDLVFSTGTSVAGDHTVFLDSISLIQRNPNELVVANPSFEGSGTVATFPGYQTSIGGWNYAAVSGNPGVNTNAGPFYDNGINPDGANIGFIQQQGTLSQMVAGFEVGKVYELLYSYNARNGLSPTLRAAIGGLEAENSVVTQAGAGNPFHSDRFIFTASATEMMLEFSNLRAAPDDSTLLIDDVHIRLIPEPGAGGLALLGLMLALRRRR